MPDSLGERLQATLGDTYRVERELPVGGMSRLFVAIERSLERSVVVKVLPPELTSEVSAARFQREMSLAAHLQHPHILPVLNAGRRDGLLFYVMPYVRGESLRDRIRREGRLPVGDAVRILGEVAGALAYAHDRGVIHRDVKPENILLEAGHAVLADFGIARAIAGDEHPATGERLTATGVSIGTPGYMAPEQIAGDSSVDERTDVYALAVVGYEMLVGAPPFIGASTHAVLAAHLVERPAAVRTLRPEIPVAVGDAIDRGLSKDPAERQASGAELQRALADATTGSTRGGGDGARAPWSSQALRSWRRPAVALGAVAVIAVVAWSVWRWLGSVAPAAASTVAVLPFAPSGPSIGYLGAGMVDLLSATLDGAGDLHSVDPRAVLAAAGRIAPTALDVGRARDIAHGLGAGLYVLGTIVENGGRLRASAVLYDGRSGRPAVRATAEGDTSDVFTIVDRLSGQLLAGRQTGPSARMTQLASVTTRSLSALKAYLEGEAALRANAFDAAVAAFQRAIAADSTFALAYFRLSIADEWLIQTAAATNAAEQAVRFDDRLSPHDRQLLAGVLAARHGDVPEAERLFRALLGTYPTDYEAWWQLGELQFHYAPILGRPIADAEPTFRRVLELDPASEPALVHLARLAVRAGRRAALDSLVARSLAAAPAGDRSYEMRIDRAVINGDSATFAALVTELGRVADFDAFLPGWSLTLFAHDFGAARRAFAPLVDPARPSDVRGRGAVVSAVLDVARGRMADADAELDRVASISTPWALEYRGLLATLPYLPVDTARVRATRASLERWDAGATPDASIPTVEFSSNNGLHPLIRAYLIGLLAARLADSAGALRAARSMVTLPAGRTHAALAAGLAGAVVAELSWRGGRAGTAVEPHFVDFYEWVNTSPFRSELRERFRRAQALAAAGEDTAAIRWFSSFETTGVDDAMFLAPSHLERARIYARRGNRALAAEHYRAFVALWRECDPSLRPVVAQAERELAAVE